MAIRAVIFDIGGVLEYTPDLGLTARWERRLDLAPGELNERLGHLWSAGSVGMISEAEVRSGVCSGLGVATEAADAMLADMWEQYLGTLNGELYDFFRALRPRYRTGILSNSFIGAREREQAYGFEDACDVIVYSHEVGMAKPDPRIYDLTCKRLGILPGEAVFLDDAEHCVDGARDAGLHAVQFVDNAQAIAALEAILAPES